MPFYIGGVVDDINELLSTSLGVFRDEHYFKDVKDIEFLGKTEALSIDRSDKKVTIKELEKGRVYDIPYDKLILAVGADPIIPRIEGVNLEGVYRLKDPLDAVEIRRAIDSGVKDVAIVGGGLIGMETCGAFASRGCRVTVYEMLDHLLPALIDKDVALLLESYLRGAGVEIHTGSRVAKVLNDGFGQVSGIETADGGRFDADLVLMAIGVRPNVTLARDAGLNLGKTGGIAVDDHLKTSDPNIYAGGDCVENTCLVTGEKVYMPLGSTANRHGRVIGDNVTGGNSSFPGITRTTVFKVLNYNVGKTGLSERQAKEAGYNPMVCVVPKIDISHYFPSVSSFTIKLVADRKMGKLLGGQILGPGDVVKRIDILATALRFSASLRDVADLDLGYSPLYSTAIDPISHASNVVRNKMDDLARGILAEELKKKLDDGEDLILLDVRMPEEVTRISFKDPRSRLIPVAQLRRRYEELPRDSEIVVICATGFRAYEAQRFLNGRNYKDVKFLEGGISAWPYPL